MKRGEKSISLMENCHLKEEILWKMEGSDYSLFIVYHIGRTNRDKNQILMSNALRKNKNSPTLKCV
jgi:hypothetical protein